MQYASPDTCDSSSHLALEHVHKRLVSVAEQMQAAITLCAPVGDERPSPTQREIARSALTVADYLRTIANGLEAMVGKRPYPRKIASPRIAAKGGVLP